ncbi:hypothetical protein PsYK624_001450 [Phanerochaete sordida]|uniref:Uncharacterized protein n=1 Tax=Phanerochaete sordida TaxID=48140 RepID=A0A9P3L6P2_9APHY|nr:hypothetical protein PsYK624_001450 [Phanerochaete sordida]
MSIKYEQPASSSSLPTPPHSPPSQHPPFFLGANQQLVPHQAHQAHIHQLHHSQPHPHHKHTASLLDNLTSFYQQEQYWVHHTRAALELAITKGIDGPDAQPLTGSSAASSALASPALSDVSCDVRIKAEPEPEHTLASPPSSASSLLASPAGSPGAVSHALQQHTSRWLRRKNQMRLHIAGISTQKRRRPARAPPTEPAARLLEMFAELVDARMESCQRMEKLVRESGRGCAVC